MARIRVYADTSVYLACAERETGADARRFFDQATDGKFYLLISSVLKRESLRLGADSLVNGILSQIPYRYRLRVKPAAAIRQLRDAYLHFGAMKYNEKPAAEHVAVASLMDIDAFVTVNFDEILNANRLAEIGRVNAMMSLPKITVLTPRAIVRAEACEGGIDLSKVKQEIRKKIASDTALMTEDELREYTWEKLLSNPMIGPLSEKIREVTKREKMEEKKGCAK